MICTYSFDSGREEGIIEGGESQKQNKTELHLYRYTDLDMVAEITNQYYEDIVQ